MTAAMGAKLAKRSWRNGFWRFHHLRHQFVGFIALRVIAVFCDFIP
jgi:hypothetical protein